MYLSSRGWGYDCARALLSLAICYPFFMYYLRSKINLKLFPLIVIVYFAVIVLLAFIVPTIQYWGSLTQVT